MVELGDWCWKKEDTQHCIYPYVYVPVDWIPRFKAGHSRVTPVKKRQGLISRLSHCQPRARGVEESDRGFRWTVVSGAPAMEWRAVHARHATRVSCLRQSKCLDMPAPM